MSRLAVPDRLFGRSRHPNLAVHLSGLALLFMAPGVLVAAAVEWGAGGPEVGPLVAAAAVLAAVGVLAWSATTVPDRPSSSTTLAAVALTWMAASVGGALPYVFTDSFPRIDDALFESVSGFTGTGSTVLSPIEGTARGVLFWRSTTQWYGGMGMVVLAVAVLPFLGVGGMSLLAAESPGPSADRLAPRVSETAKRLWLIYAGFTLVAVVLLMGVGLSLYDAVSHAFTVVSTGGLSPYDSSIGHFDSVAVELTFVVLMLYGGTSFTLHWQAVTGRPSAYLHSSMFRWYAGVYAGAVAAVILLLVVDGSGLGESVRSALFNVATLLTSTGYGTDDFTLWTPTLQLLLLGLMIAGGMAGSTAGGMKQVRVRVALQAALRELRRFRFPHAVLPLRLGSNPVPEEIVARILGHVALFMLIVIAGTFVIGALGADLVTGVSAVISMMSNMGPGLGEAGPASNFLVFSRPARGVLMFLMLVGRLEMLAVLVGIGQLWSLAADRRFAHRRAWSR